MAFQYRHSLLQVSITFGSGSQKVIWPAGGVIFFLLSKGTALKYDIAIPDFLPIHALFPPQHRPGHTDKHQKQDHSREWKAQKC